MLLLQVEETCCNNELASTFFNKFLICCSYYHPRNKFMRNKIWETSSDWSKLALQHSANFLTAKMNWKQKLSEGQKCEYRSSITNRSTSCGTTILFSPNQNVQSRHPSTSSPLLTSLTKAHLFLMYWRTSKNFQLISVYFLPFSLHGQTQFAHCVRFFLSCLRKYYIYNTKFPSP